MVVYKNMFLILLRYYFPVLSLLGPSIVKTIYCFLVLAILLAKMFTVMPLNWEGFFFVSLLKHGTVSS